ncbi:MAG: hypothetical protein A2428_03655 [Bdellovibrionales bacterium RIFOXYC1_FULL_54_43]|nr:MAG: hypothetical protein A2428_03655 [Bdellovibrionales bacterium RIFOXYC1_FULL_54_43]OFZ83807.1 MAG: hypothetical protein A2603_11080 [Bdellovibrionales bacterium RIFOXYD1_FULL_55_31]
MSSYLYPKSRYQKLIDRRTPRELGGNIRLDERIRNSSLSSETVKYVLGSMTPVDPEYTANTFKQGERVRGQLENNLPSTHAAEFAYQGSVTTDTHIKLYSDIDLLTVAKAFHCLKQPLQPTFPWAGDPVQHLMELRGHGTRVLKEKFPQAKVDTTGSKAVAISEGSLTRSVDVVFCNWLDTEHYRMYGSDWRGIQILDTSGPTRVTNYPFLHKRRLDDVDRAVYGSLKKIIRFVKSVKADADVEIKVSSYHIAGLACSMAPADLMIDFGDELKLVTNFYGYAQYLLANEPAREKLMTPNGHEPLFKGIELSALQRLVTEIAPIAEEIKAFQFYGYGLARASISSVFRDLASR